MDNRKRNELLDTVLDLLAGWSGVSARRLFSGHGLYRDGVIFAIVIGDTLYLKVDDESRAAFTDRGSAPFVYNRRQRRVSLPGYYEAPPELFDEPEEMLRWSRRALDAAVRRRQQKRPTTRKRPQRGSGA